MNVGDRIHITIKELYSLLVPSNIKFDIDGNDGYYIVDETSPSLSTALVRGSKTNHRWKITTNYFDIRYDKMEYTLPEELFKI